MCSANPTGKILYNDLHVIISRGIVRKKRIPSMAPREEEKIVLTRAELQELAEEVVDNTLAKLGIDATDFHEVQKDMIYLRRTRRLREAVEERKIFLVIGIGFTVVMSLIGLGLVAWVKGLP